MARLATFIIGSLVTMLCVSSSLAQVPVQCPSKTNNQFLLVEWNIRQNATMSSVEIANMLGAPLAALLSQTPGFQELISESVNDTTVRIITLFSNTQQLLAARNTVSMFVLNNLISQIILVNSRTGTVQSDVINQELCNQNTIAHGGRFIAIRVLQTQPGVALASTELTGQVALLSTDLQQLPGFSEFFTLVTEDNATSQQVILVSIFETASQANEAAVRMQQFTSAGSLAGQLQLVQADVSQVAFDQFVGTVV